MGIGTARGDDRAVAAAEMAISSPLLEASIDGAHGVLLSIQGGSDLGLFEINEAAQLVANSAATDANIIFGAVIDDALGDEVRVTVIAAGFDEPQPGRPRPRTTAYSTAPYSADLPAASAGSGGGPAEWRPFHLGDARPAGTASLPGQAPAADTGRPPANGGPPASVSSGGASSGGASSGGGPNSSTDGAMSDAVDSIPPPRTSSPDDAVESGARDLAGPRPNRPDTTRRKSVVFEEDDELDVPDFLK
jgi:cell division protein FtsZ